MTDGTEQPEEKKIFIDEDWKARVQAEREALNRPEEPGGPAADRAAGAAEIPLPPPSLELLATSLSVQAMIALGLVPHPAGGKQELHLAEAKHLVDTIQMLQDKTAGNRTDQESATLEAMLHELRLAYVHVQSGAPAGSA